METPDYFISNTHNGDLASIRSAIKMMEDHDEDGIQELWDRGEKFQNDFNELSPRVQLEGYPTRGQWKGEEIDIWKFSQEMYYRKWVIGRAWFLNYQHTPEQLDRFLYDSSVVLQNLDQIEFIGPLPKPVFKRN